MHGATVKKNAYRLVQVRYLEELNFLAFIFKDKTGPLNVMQ
jgi:hypothetical protein